MRKYPTKPIDVRGGKVWFYINARRIEVVTQLRDNNNEYIGTTIAEIPWSYIEQAMKIRKAALAK